MKSGKLTRERPDSHEHYLNRARVAAERSTCLRRKVGAVIIKDGAEVSSGYVGSPRGTEHCTDTGKCLRIELGVRSGERYELCRSVHAEQNAIINAARTGANIFDAEMYISSEKVRSGYSERAEPNIYGPCILCMKEIINAGLQRVHMREEGVGTRTYSVEDLKLMLREAEEGQKRSFKRKPRKARSTKS